MRGMELLARCIEWDDEKLKALQDEQSTLNEEIEKKNQLWENKRATDETKEKEQKEKNGRLCFRRKKKRKEK